MSKSYSVPVQQFIWLAVLMVLMACGQKSPNTSAHVLSTAQGTGNYVPGQIFSDRMKKALYGPEMMVVAPGQFMLGAVDGDKEASNQEKPVHKVVLKHIFAVSRTEISVAQFRAFIMQSSYQTDADKRGFSEIFDLVSGRLLARQKINWQFNHIGALAADDYPVVHISFNDAQAYVHWLSERTGKHYRLASEAEWEYLLRAGSESIYPWGEKLKELRKGNLAGELDVFPNQRIWGNAIKNYADGYWGLAPVRQYSSEVFGTFDMLGNVSEWVEDCWHENYRRAPVNGEAWVNPGCLQRVVRGSAWLSGAEQSRSSFRMSMDAKVSNALVGFRIIRVL